MLLARLNHLPDTSALAASVQGVPRGWGGDRHALVTLIDALQQNTWATVKVGGSRARKPKAIERPRPKRTRVTVSIRDLLQAEASRATGEGVDD